MMEKLIYTLSVFAVLTWACPTAQAQTFGAIDSTQTFRLELNSTSTAAAKGSVTVYWLKDGGIVDIELLGAILPPGDVLTPRRARRVVYEVTPAPNSSMLFKLSQGPLFVEENFLVPTRIVFTIVAGP